MKKYKAVLIDDERPALNVLEYVIKNDVPQVEVIRTFQKTDEALAFIKNEKPDLAFVDIQMESINGLDFISKINGINTKFIITTAHHEYALDAWKTKALAYLLKPIDALDIKSALERLDFQKNEIDTESEINIGPESFLPSQIISITAAGAYSHIRLVQNRKLILSKNLKFIVALLPQHKFYRVHRSQVINIDHLISFEENSRKIELLEGISAEVSERKLADFKSSLKEYKDGRN